VTTRRAKAVYQISRFTSASWQPGEVSLFNSRSAVRIESESQAFLGLLQHFLEPSTLPTRLAKDETAVLRALLEGQFLVPKGSEDRGDLQFWEPHDLLFHTRSRLGPGGTFRFKGKVPPKPLFAPPRSRAIVRLPKPAAKHAHADFLTLLEKRRSVSHFAEQGPDLRQLATLLYYAARSTGELPGSEGSGGLGYRPYPGGGGVHPIELYLVVPPDVCKGLPGGAYHYRPKEHVLERAASPGKRAEALLARAKGSTATTGRGWVLVAMTARFARIAWKYEGIAYGLVLKEVGCILQTFHLVGEALGLGVRALGNGPFADLNALVGVDRLVEPPVGELLIGRPTRRR
jgi:SagB-type dehydrogenase family enzyme